MNPLTRFVRWVTREIKLYRLRRDMERQEKVWLSTMLIKKFSSDVARERAGKSVASQFLKTQEIYDKEKGSCEF